MLICGTIKPVHVRAGDPVSYEVMCQEQSVEDLDLLEASAPIETRVPDPPWMNDPLPKTLNSKKLDTPKKPSPPKRVDNPELDGDKVRFSLASWYFGT